MAIRLGSEGFTAASNCFADMSSGYCGSESAIANGLLNGRALATTWTTCLVKIAVFAKNRDAARFGLRFRTLCPTTPQLSIDGMPRFRRHADMA